MCSEKAVGKIKVAKIEYAGKQDVFNMEVEGVHSFVVNYGIVSHNCYDDTRYFLMARPVAPTRKRPPVYKGFDPFDRGD